MKNPLEGLTIAVTGDFGPQRSLERMRHWIHNNGGTFSDNVKPGVTHLVCSKKHFKNNVMMVKSAHNLGTVKIVSWDWLEDSLLHRRRFSERKYLFGGDVKKERKEKKKVTRNHNIQLGLETFEKGCKEFEKEMHSKGYHLYTDHTNYSYDITLTRADLLTNHNERHILKLYESNAVPKLFACFERHSAPGKQSVSQQLAPIGTSFHVAYDIFKKFFKLKTGIDWERRLENWGVRDGSFVFMPPKEGEPQGITLRQYEEEEGNDMLIE